MNHKKGILALSPLIVFVMVYLISSIVAHDFYKMPITIAFVISCVYAIATFRGGSLNERIEAFCTGAGNKDIILMLCIFVLAGAFANSAKTAGCIDATVNFTLSILPQNTLLPGLFLATCFISLAIGTSVGTIVALTPVAVGLSTTTGISTPLLVAIVVGGSFFGDNLSFISDTTIVATNTQQCKQSDKFIVNAYSTIPCALIVMALYVLLTNDYKYITTNNSIEYIRIIPYLIVIISSIIGVNVLAVLTLGCISTGIVGFYYGNYDFLGWCGSMGVGISGMSDLIVVAVLSGGLLKILHENGAMNYIISIMTKRINGKRSCELTIASLVSIVNICTANNTIAILTVGNLSHTIGNKYGVDNRKNASILDTFSCCIQSILPYGAQILCATGLSSLSPLSIIEYLYYPFALFIVSLAAIIFRYPKKFS